MASTASKNVYLDAHNPWMFAGYTSSKQYEYAYKYGASHGDTDFPQGYVIVWGAKNTAVNGIYDAQTVSGIEYQGPFMKRLTDNDDDVKGYEQDHCLKFSLCKGIKIVPMMEKYQDDDEFDREDNSWQHSPRHDAELAHYRWDLIQDTKQQMTSDQAVKFVDHPDDDGGFDGGVLPSDDDDDDEHDNEQQLQYYYQGLLRVKKFKYEYIYTWDKKLKQLVHVKQGAKDTAQFAFVRNFAFHESLYPELAECINNIPKTYQRKREKMVAQKLSILMACFEGIVHLARLVFELVSDHALCLHPTLTHITCGSEGKNAMYYSQYFVCDQCETSVSVPSHDDMCEQLLFVSRCRRSFGVERNGRKSSHTRHLHSFRLRQWMQETRFGGATHEYIGKDTVSVYSTDDIDDQDRFDDNNKIGEITNHEKVFVIWHCELGKNKLMVAVRTLQGIVGFCIIHCKEVDAYNARSDHDADATDDVQLRTLRISYKEATEFIVSSGIIVSTMRVETGDNPVHRIRRTLHGLLKYDD